MIEHSKIEKLLRELLSTPIDMLRAANKDDFEKVKKLARSILKSWADLRRQTIQELEQAKKRATIVRNLSP